MTEPCVQPTTYGAGKCPTETIPLTPAETVPPSQLPSTGFAWDNLPFVAILIVVVGIILLMFGLFVSRSVNKLHDAAISAQSDVYEARGTAIALANMIITSATSHDSEQVRYATLMKEKYERQYDEQRGLIDE